jgi:hypothetical protein
MKITGGRVNHKRDNNANNLKLHLNLSVNRLAPILKTMQFGKNSRESLQELSVKEEWLPKSRRQKPETK